MEGAIAGSGLEPQAADRLSRAVRRAGQCADDVARWLLRQGRHIRAEPACALQRAFCAPAGSPVLAAARSFHRRPTAMLVSAPPAWPRERFSLSLLRTPEKVCWSPDGTRLLVALGDSPSEAIVVDSRTAETLGPLQGSHSKPLRACAWGLLDAASLFAWGDSEVVQVLFTGDSAGEKVMWSKVGAPLAAIPDPTDGAGEGVASLHAHGGGAQRGGAAPLLAAAFARKALAALWRWGDDGAWRLQFVFRPEGAPFMPDSNRQVLFTEDGAGLLVASSRYSGGTGKWGGGCFPVHLLDTGTGAPLRIIQGACGPLAAVPQTGMVVAWREAREQACRTLSERIRRVA